MSRHVTLLSFPSLVLEPGMTLVESKLLELGDITRSLRLFAIFKEQLA